ncbi:hypothetical protein CAEBREN_13810 [Caenorhabditis brenneri]|uniref:Uncharacterized protein n=1 Tax=Caenorhabditis brenneri TaxID=135651 RepID=G0MMR4_CAEBE|nr:hypothetical protein CAEBREN_13810 [Caenorhabditis brenneri]
MEHLQSANDNEQDPDIQMASDSSPESPSAGLENCQNPPLAIDPHAMSIRLSDFSRYLPQVGSVPNSGLQSPGNTTTSDGSVQDFGGQGLLSPGAISDFSHSTQDTMPFSATVPGLSKLISQIQGSQGLLNNGHPTLPGTQSIGVHHDYQDSLSEFNAAHYTNNPILNATVPILSSLLIQIQGIQGFINNKNPAHLTPQPVDMHHQDLLNSHPIEPNNNQRLSSATSNTSLPGLNQFSSQLLLQNMLNASFPTPPTNLAAQIDFNTLLAGLWRSLTQKIMKHVSHPIHNGNAVEALNYILGGQNTGAQASNDEPCSSNAPNPSISQLMLFSNNNASANIFLVTPNSDYRCATSTAIRQKTASRQKIQPNFMLRSDGG